MNNIFLIKKTHSYLQHKGRLFFSRRKAHILRREMVKKRGYEIVDRKKSRALKTYAKETFGSSSFWPWLSLYTEIRGEFKAGWIPNDYYTAHLLKKYNPESIRISDYKTFDNKMFPDFALQPLVIKIGKNFYDTNRKQITATEVENILFDYNNEVVIKDDLGFGGHKIKFIRSRKLNLENYSEISSYVIQPAVHQHENLRLLNAKAVCTIRVFTYLNGEGNIDVKYTYLRFGTGDSRVDNVSSGGGFCFVKPDGNLADVAYDKSGTKMERNHPDTGTLFKSVTIPNYKKVLEKCIKSHKTFPYVKFIGWDVTVNSSGEPVLLEWNLKPLFWVAEAVHGPFFKEEFMGNDISNPE